MLAQVKRRVFYTTIALLLLASVLASATPKVSAGSDRVLVIHLDDEVSYTMAEYVISGIEEGNSGGYKAILILINTPGGKVDAMKKIVSAILSSRTPVITYVYPSGASAWSAGTFILLAGHIAAMAPGTVTGSSQPIYYDPLTGTVVPVNDTKVINALLGLLKEICKVRGRNYTVAEKFVTENLNVGPDEALKYGLIDVVASDIYELLSKVNGTVVKSGDREVKIVFHGVPELVEYRKSFKVLIMLFLEDPVISSLFMSIGFLLLLAGALRAEPYSALVGIVLILLSLYGLGFNVNAIALALLVIGLVLLAIEVFVTPGFGLIGAGGIVLMALGIILLPTIPPGWILSPYTLAFTRYMVFAIAGFLAAFAALILYAAIKSKLEKPVLVDVKSIKGVIAIADDDIPRGGEGFVKIGGEYWRARALDDIKKGEKVIVVGKDGAILIVKKYAERIEVK